MSKTVETAKLVDAACDIGVAAEKMATTPGSLLVKLASLWPLLGDIQTLTGVDYPAALAELKALDTAGAAALEAEIASHLNFPNKVFVSDIVQAVTLLYAQEQLVAQFVALGKKLKG